MTLRSFFVMQTIVERKVNFYAEKLKRIKDGVRYILYFYAKANKIDLSEDYGVQCNVSILTHICLLKLALPNIVQ